MSSVPGPRTSPTVKSQANSNQRNLRSWRITLGPVQTVMIVGLVTGAMACAFYLGFFSGQKVGIETALNNNLSSAMRLPIESSSEDLAADEDAMTDVYAKLNDNVGEDSKPGTIAVKKSNPNGKDSYKMPELGSIETTDAAPVAEVVGGDSGSDAAADMEAVKKALQGKQAKAPSAPDMNLGVSSSLSSVSNANQQVRVLGEKPAFGASALGASGSTGSPKTLGALAQEAAPIEKVKPAVEKESAAIPEIKPSSLNTQKETIAKTTIAEPAPALSKTTSVSADKEKIKVASSSDIEAARREVSKASTASEQPAKVVSKQQAKEAVAAEPSVPKGPLPHGWFAQIVAPKSSQEAESMAKKLKAAGFPVVIENALVRDENYYRVLVGPEDSRDQAERLIGQLKRESYIKADPFLRMVK